MKKKLFLLAIVAIVFAALVGCTEDTLVAKLDKDLYAVEYGSVVRYSVLNVPDVEELTVSVSNESIISIDGDKLEAIKVGVATLTVNFGDMKMSAIVVVLPKALEIPVVTIEDNVAFWEPVENADKYIINIGTKVVEQTQTSYDLSSLATGEYTINVSASSTNENYKASVFCASDFSVEKAEVNPQISFETNGGTALSPITAVSGSAVKMNAPIKNGYTFIGWYTDSKFYNEFNNIMPNSDTTLYARWIEGTVQVVNQGKSIQSAINSRIEKTAIFVKPGIYKEYITLSQGLALYGNNFDTLPGDAKKSETVIYPIANEDFNYTTGRALITVNTPDVTISGFTLDGDNPDLKNIWTKEKNDAMQALAAGDTASRIEVRRHYDSLVGKDTGIDGALAISVVRSNTTDPSLANVAVENNIIKNFAYTGILMHNNNHTKAILSNEGVRIINNEISGVKGYGLLQSKTEYVGVYGEAIILDGVAAKVDGNIFFDNAYAIQHSWIYTTGNVAEFTNNKFINNSVGLWINATGFSDGTIISNNEFIKDDNYAVIDGMHSYSDYAILVSGSENGSLNISDNTISGFDAGILFAGVRENTVLVERNNISDCNSAVALRRNFSVFTTNSVTSVTLRNDNIYLNNQQDLEVDTPTSNYFKATTINAQDEIVDTVLRGNLAAATVALSGTNVRFKTVVNATSYKLFLNGVDVSAGLGEPDASGYIYYALDLVGEALEVYTFKVEAHSDSGLSSSVSKELNLVRVTTIDKLMTATPSVAAPKTVYKAAGVLLSTVAVSTKSGYILDGWYADEALTSYVDNTATVLNTSGTFYGVWLKTAAYTFYDDASAVIEAVTFKYGDVISLEDAPAAPVKEGYEFVGWFNSTKATATQYQFPLTANGTAVKLYAKYVQVG